MYAQSAHNCVDRDRVCIREMLRGPWPTWPTLLSRPCITNHLVGTFGWPFQSSLLYLIKGAWIVMEALKSSGHTILNYNFLTISKEYCILVRVVKS